MKRCLAPFFIGCMGIGGLIFGCKEGAPRSSEMALQTTDRELPEVVSFTNHVKPLLSDRCFKCHGPDKNAIEGDLSLHTAQEAYKALGKLKDRHAIVPKDPGNSTLVERIYSEDPNLQMPPPEANLALTDHERALLKKWVAQGAEYETHWAFVPPEPQAIPETKGQWGSNAIDAFVLKKLEDHGMAPSARASKEKLLRRVSFDLTGLPPSMALMEQFLQDSSPRAYEKVIDRLLATKDHAEHMAAEWMDISRYADTHGYQDDFERTMWPWRDWVIHAFDKNMPYDAFVTYQLAGDLLPNANLEQILATGFNRNHKITAEGGVIPEEYRTEYVADRTQTLGIAFLGLTLECARCHDHKYDPISQEEHFEFFSFFNTIPEKGLLSSATEIPEPYVMVSEKDAQGVLHFINMQNSPTEEVPVMVMKEMETPRKTFLLDRGAYDRPTVEVFPKTPESILPYKEEYPKNRLGLAQWLFSEDNPLTARVAVNRLWQRMFGTGIVSSTYDFGNQGALPTHPELLDFLALKLRDEGWDMDGMLKFMALSETYRQRAQISPEMLEMDSENKLLARAPRLRLSAEMIRDQALAVSGLLNKEVGGPSVKPYQPEGIWEETTGGGGGSTASYVQGTGGDLYRKSLYTFWKRTVPPPSMMTFDAASRDLCTVKRQETNTPLQALVLMNDPQMIEAARAMAYHTQKAKGGSLKEQIAHMFRLATSRLPNERELQSLLEYHDAMLAQVRQGDVDAEAYLSIGAFEVGKEVDKAQMAALALTSHTILNLDETITRG
ncbi:PSD1 and planctomycete cytochrome C domain-containing protein [Maribacter sp. 2307ULW6-5]|uniref:PSD1 and planctomycete cytochrome C domain-containing protein n=1 Tax=Maribacter sp. 2307ULW6-5 TaxID=3386275 RepID=UPI0039BD3113